MKGLLPSSSKIVLLSVATCSNYITYDYSPRSPFWLQIKDLFTRSKHNLFLQAMQGRGCNFPHSPWLSRLHVEFVATFCLSDMNVLYLLQEAIHLSRPLHPRAFSERPSIKRRAPWSELEGDEKDEGAFHQSNWLWRSLSSSTWF